MRGDVLGGAKRKILLEGPDRVVVLQSGVAVPSRVARESYGVVPDVIFIRDDGWTLGAANELRETAFSLWGEYWIAKWERGEPEPERL